MRTFPILSLLIISFLFTLAHLAPAQSWRSQLYPEDWQPVDAGGSPDSQGRFLHDFSYAGYHKGEAPIPTQIGSLTDVTQAPYNADNTGSDDVTLLIQQAIDDVAAAGGGTVYLPAGTYRLTTGSRSYGLRINQSNVLLKGAGPNQTYLFIDQEEMRRKTAILLAAEGDQARQNIWNNYSDGNELLLSEDHLLPTRTIKLTSVAGLSVGDWIVINTLCNNAWAEEHGLLSDWGNKLDGITYYRKVTQIDNNASTIEIDIPTRYYLKTRDQARVYKLSVDPITEVGISDLSIGQRQNSGSGFDSQDYRAVGTGAYQIHAAHLVAFSMVVDGWLTNVNTYRPSVNTSNYHMPSNGVVLYQSCNVTVEDTDFSYPQYEGGGGNGYSYTHHGSDNLITNAVAASSRHSFSAKAMWCSGNVYKDCEIVDGNRMADFHMHFCHANLVENFRGEDFNADYRPYGTINHGHTSSENVFWRFDKTSENYRVKSQQWGWGYVVGADRASNPAPTQGDSIQDFVEGTGLGATLEPQSLYLDQLSKRLNSDTITNPGGGELVCSVSPSDDAYVRDGSQYNNQNYGSDTNLPVKDAPNSSLDRQSFLRFDLSTMSGTATSAKLLL